MLIKDLERDWRLILRKWRKTDNIPIPAQGVEPTEAEEAAEPHRVPIAAENHVPPASFAGTNVTHCSREGGLVTGDLHNTERPIAEINATVLHQAELSAESDKSQREDTALIK